VILYRRALRSLWACLPLIIGVEILLTVVDRLVRFPFAQSIYSFLAYTFVAIMAHRAILLRESMWTRDGWTRPPDTHPGMFAGQFLWMAFLFSLTPTVLAILAIFGTLTNPYLHSQSSIWIGMAVLLGFAFQGVALSIWGTILPAAAKGSHMTLKQARSRGAPLLWRTLIRLAYGPLAFSIVFGGIVFGMLQTLPPALWPIFGFIAGACFTMTIFLAASALSLAYQETAQDA